MVSAWVAADQSVQQPRHHIQMRFAPLFGTAQQFVQLRSKVHDFGHH